MLDLEPQPAPEFELTCTNDLEVVSAMGDAIHAELTSRFARGIGARGPLPKPKDGGAPLRRTGTLEASIAVEVKQTNAGPVAIVRPTGDRPPEENAGEKAKQARRKTTALRKATKHALMFAQSSGQAVDPRFLRKKPSKTGETFKLSRIRVRAAVTNGALAAILSTKPKDLRAANGNRAQYRVFEGNRLYQDKATEAAKALARFELKAK